MLMPVQGSLSCVCQPEATKSESAEREADPEAMHNSLPEMVQNCAQLARVEGWVPISNKPVSCTAEGRRYTARLNCGCQICLASGGRQVGPKRTAQDVKERYKSFLCLAFQSC